MNKTNHPIIYLILIAILLPGSMTLAKEEHSAPSLHGEAPAAHGGHGSAGAHDNDSAAPSLHGHVSMAYQSKYVFRGLKEADSVFLPTVELTYGSFFLETLAILPLENPHHEFHKKVEFMGGFDFELGEHLSLRGGLTYYWLPEVENLSVTKEVFFGLGLQNALEPKLNFYYDFDLETLSVEGALGHRFVLGQSVDSPLALRVGANLGYTDTNKESGLYYGGRADFSYSFTHHSSLSAGVRASHIDSAISHHGPTSNFWWGISFLAGF